MGRGRALGVTSVPQSEPYRPLGRRAYTLAFDPGGDQELEFQRLIEDSALRKFSEPRAANRLRAECVREGDAMTLRFFVNGKRLTETKHEALGELVGRRALCLFGKGGTDIRFDNVLVRAVPQ